MRKRAILLSEDDKALRRMLARALRANGYRVLEADNGADALELYERETADISLLISDIEMPEMDGLTLRQRVLKMNPGAQVLLMSGQASDPGCADSTFLKKPFGVEDLLNTVRVLLAA